MPLWDDCEKYEKRIHPGSAQMNAIYAAMIESMDDTVGRVRRQLDKLNPGIIRIINITSSAAPRRMARFAKAISN